MPTRPPSQDGSSLAGSLRGERAHPVDAADPRTASHASDAESGPDVRTGRSATTTVRVRAQQARA